MTCNPLVEPTCLIVGKVVQPESARATGDILGGIAQAISDGIKWIVENTATWWVQIPSPNLSTEPAVSHIQQWLLPITAAVAVGGVIAAATRMAITGRANPLLDLGGGLLTLAAATALGATIAALLLKAGDAWSSWVLQASTGGHFTQRLDDILDLGAGAAPAVVLIFGVIAIIFALVQAVLMLFRQTALIILAGALPLAAAGSIAPMTRTWVRKVAAWMLALICYKPAAAAVYAAAFTMIGSGGGPRTALMGFAMLALSVVMLPALMKFFTWTTGSIAGGGNGGQILGTAAMGAVAVGAMRSSSGGAASAAQDQASYLSSRLGPPPAGGESGSPGSPPAGPGSGEPDGYPGSSTPSYSAAQASRMTFSSGTGRTSAGAVPTGAASAGTNPAAAAAGPSGFAGAAGRATATGAAAAAGPATAAAAAGSPTAAPGTRPASGAMEPGDAE
jgi:hypothetical protein